MPHYLEDQDSHVTKIAVLGAAGGIGQSLSLLLKTGLAPLVLRSPGSHVHMAMYDVNRDAVAGAATDLSHIDTPVSVSFHAPDDAGLERALTRAQIVVIPAGVPRKPGMTRDDLFAVNARIVAGLGDAIAAHCDLAHVAVLLISNPVNSLVPVLVERLAAHGAEQAARHVFGLTQLDAVRASTFLRDALGSDSHDMPLVPVVGGHSGDTIVPLLSQAPGANALSPDARRALVHRVQYGGDEVVQAKNGAGSATLSMAYAAARVTAKFVELQLGLVPELHDTLYVQLRDARGRLLAPGAEQVAELVPGVEYFSVPVTVTGKGVSHVHGEVLARMDAHERAQLLPVCVKNLSANIRAGQEWVAAAR